MNWVDITIIVVLACFAYKGLRLGLISSLFSIVSFLLSVFLATKYYRPIYEFIVNNEILYKIFENITKAIINLFFYSRIEKSPDFLINIISQGFIKIIISLVSIVVIFSLANMVIKAVLSVFTLLFRIPIFKGLNKIGGMIFGLAKGIFVIYFINFIINQTVGFFPDSKLGDAIQNSLILTYLQTVDIFSLLLDFRRRKYI
jgi:uncharacterized membrane protein required for colicin V production